MKIGSVNNIGFKGTFYLTADKHSRAPMSAGTLTKIQNLIQNDKSGEPSFLLDGGDFSGEVLPNFVMADVFKVFKKQNPKVKCVINLGNADFFYHNDGDKGIKECIDILTKSDIDVISANAKWICEKYNKEGKKKNPKHEDIRIPDGVKTYVMLTDIVEGEEQNILVSGITAFDSSENPDNINMQKYALEKIVAPAVRKHRPDRTILMMHDNYKDVEKLLNYAQELGIENIELVPSGHPHAIGDKTYGRARILYPPAQGKGAYIVKNTKKGFEFPPLKTNIKDGYDYDILSENPADAVIANANIDKPLEIADCYKKILNLPAYSEYMKVIVDKMPPGLIYRDDYPAENISYVTSLGTLAANSLREQTGSDIGLFLSLHFRERFPSEGKPVTMYNLADSLCFDKIVYKAESVSVAELKEIFEASFRRQHMVKANSDFFEYSNNLKVTRLANAPQDNGDEEFERVRQIHYKENGKWTELLDEAGRPKDTDKIFSIATCDYAARAGRDSLNCFKDIKSAPYEELTLRKAVTKALNDFDPNEDNSCSILENEYS